MLQKILDAQYRRPSGLLGHWVGRKMAQQHVSENTWTVGLLTASPDDRILEIGFGPGLAIEQLSRVVTSGLIAGIDFSPTMVTAASERNAQAVRNGQADLRLGDAARLPFADASFNKAYSIHSIYFWQHPEAVLREIYRVLKKNGMLILTVLPKEKWNADDPAKPVGTLEYKAYSGAELVAMLRNLGFSSTRIECDSTAGASPSNYSVIAMKC